MGTTITRVKGGDFIVFLPARSYASADISRRCVSVLFVCVCVCVSVSLCVCHTPVFVSNGINVGSRKQCHVIAQIR